METKKDIFDIFEADESFRYIMKRLLEVSMEESFNSVVITEAGPGYPIVYANAAFSELTGYGPHEIIGKSPSILQGPNTDKAVLERLNSVDLIICNGMANYESFSETNYLPIAYLLRTKCDAIASSMNLPLNINAIKLYE